MKLRSKLRRILAPRLVNHPAAKQALVRLDTQIETLRHTAAHVLPGIIRAMPRSLTVSITAACNYRCGACRYGRDFMPGKQLRWETAKLLLEDAHEAGVEAVRLYGGEPLLHPDLPKMVSLCTRLGFRTLLTTNAMLLGERIDELYSAGLRSISIGYYGTGGSYDTYVQREAFQRMEEGVAEVRRRYGSKVGLQLNWLLMRQTCSLESLSQAVAFAERYEMTILVDLIHYSLPYFTEGRDGEFQFRREDEPAIQRIAAELLRLKKRAPHLLKHSEAGLASIKDWLLLRADMRIPCDRYDMIWVGPDGTVQLCYVCFPLGNLHQQRLREMMFTETHHQAARDAFQTNCPNCHCNYDLRIQKHLPSRLRYGKLATRNGLHSQGDDD